ncbi:unnamed protein product [Debaryomyces fabryi]|nr:unnamed protein product [Debaryomyces fabryi]
MLSSLRTRNRHLPRTNTNTSNNSASTNQQSKRARIWYKMKASMVKYSSFIGPGLMVSVAYMDPGNYATGITAGASNRYSLLFIVFLSNIIAIFLQSLCVKLGSVTGYDLARCCREYLPRKLNIVLWILAECAIIATDVAEVIGSAIALNILLKIPLPAGVAITIVDVLFVLMAYRNDTSSTKFVKFFEYAVALLVVAVVVCFAVELSQIPGDIDTVRAIFRGYLPSLEMFRGSGMTIATSIIGSTVMIHSLFLGSGIVQPRLREYDVQNGYVMLDELIDAEDEVILNEKSESKQRRFIEDKEAAYFYNSYKPSYQAIEYSFKYSIIELVVTLFTFALFVNLAILIIAGSTLYDTPEAMDADLYAIHNLLSTNLAPVVGTVFMLALLFSGQSAGIVCTIAGQIVSEGHINWTVKPWLRRLITRGIAIVPCMIISLCIGKNGLDEALNISQVVISILLPPLTAPLIYFTCKKSIMKIEIPADLQLHGSSEVEVEVQETQETIDTTDSEQDIKYKYMNNNWLTTILVVLIWLFVSVLNIYAIVDMARNGVAGS